MSPHSLRALIAVVVATALGAAPAPGWRGDGTGQFPGTEPPIHWSSSSNVVWKVPLPGWGNASPVISGDRVCVAAEPTQVLCLNKDDGRVLWSRSLSVLDGLEPGERAGAAAEMETARTAQKKLREHELEYERLKREARKGKAGPESLERLKAMSAEMKSLRDEIALHGRHLMPDDLTVLGYTTPTPSTDGKYLYVIQGSGVVASLALADGSIRWARWLGFPEWSMNGYFKGQAASPILSGRKLIIGFKNLLALDADTGRTLWTGPSYLDYGAPALVQAGGTEVIVTPAGEVVRVADGVVVQKGLESIWYEGPLAVDGGVFVVGGSEQEEQQSSRPCRASAWSLVAGAGGVVAQARWRQNIVHGRYYASPVRHDGHLFALSADGQLSILDERNGAVIETRQMGMGVGTCYPSLAAAGKYLYVSSDNGSTVVLQGSRPWKEVSRNTLEEFRSSPLFVGRRLYVRSLDHLYCIEEGAPASR